MLIIDKRGDIVASNVLLNDKEQMVEWASEFMSVDDFDDLYTVVEDNHFGVSVPVPEPEEIPDVE